jgi:hypothetical protein
MTCNNSVEQKTPVRLKLLNRDKLAMVSESRWKSNRKPMENLQTGMHIILKGGAMQGLNRGKPKMPHRDGKCLISTACFVCAFDPV